MVFDESMCGDVNDMVDLDGVSAAAAAGRGSSGGSGGSRSGRSGVISRSGEGEGDGDGDGEDGGFTWRERTRFDERQLCESRAEEMSKSTSAAMCHRSTGTFTVAGLDVSRVPLDISGCDDECACEPEPDE